MVGIHALRENPEPARVSQRIHGGDVEFVDRVLETDALRRTGLQEFESLRASQKETSKPVDEASKEGCPVILAKAKELAEQVKVLEAHMNEAGAEADRLACPLLNLVLGGVPVGGEENLMVLCHEGPAIRDLAAEDSEPAGYFAVGEGLDAIDTKRGVEVLGARFYCLKGTGTRLELALMTIALDQVLAAGSVPTTTLTLVTPQVMGGTDLLNEHSEEAYYLSADNLYLTGTSGVTLVGCHSDKVLDLFTGLGRCLDQSACYRREAGSAGKDTCGIIRVYQFNKIEILSYYRPEEAAEERERFLAWGEKMLRKVELPYRVIDTVAGDLGTFAARKSNCEVWLPTQSRYMEVTPTSNCTTSQARRFGVRGRREDGMFSVATLNDTPATTRQFVAIPGNYQLADGSFCVPEALYPHLGGLEVLEPVK